MAATPLQALAYVFQSLASLYLIVIMLRFLLQISRADFYNPISQFVVKATNPLLIPLRRVVPPFGKYDAASIVLAVLFQALVIAVVVYLKHDGVVGNPLLYLVWGLVGVLQLVVSIYLFAIFITIILSFIAPGSYHPAVSLLQQLTEPVMAPARKLLPPVGGLDFSPILVLLAIQVIDMLVVSNFAVAVGMPRGLVLGW